MYNLIKQLFKVFIPKIFIKISNVQTRNQSNLFFYQYRLKMPENSIFFVLLWIQLIASQQFHNIQILSMTKQYISQLQFQQLTAQLLQDLQNLSNNFLKNGSTEKNMEQNSNKFYAEISAVQSKISHLNQQFDKVYRSLVHCQLVIFDYEQKMEFVHIREISYLKKIRCLEEDYVQTFNIIQKHQLQIKTLKAFNNIDASFIPSFQMEDMQEQKQRASTRIISYESDADSCQFGRYLKDISKKQSYSDSQQQDDNEQIYMRNQDLYKLTDKQEKNIYDLLVQIDEAGIKQLQMCNKIWKNRSNETKIIETQSIEYP